MSSLSLQLDEETSETYTFASCFSFRCPLPKFLCIIVVNMFGVDFQTSQYVTVCYGSEYGFVFLAATYHHPISYCFKFLRIYQVS